LDYTKSTEVILKMPGKPWSQKWDLDSTRGYLSSESGARLVFGTDQIQCTPGRG